jgi:hypothetical protein
MRHRSNDPAPQTPLEDNPFDDRPLEIAGADNDGIVIVVALELPPMSHLAR